MSKNALIIFTRNPELGKCKTRLAKTIGNQKALEVYTALLEHTAVCALKTSANLKVFYSETIIENDLWNSNKTTKHLQQGKSLGERMHHAFQSCFTENYENVIIIGSDLLDLSSELISEAFLQLNNHDLVMGPAQDGGYYLLGMKQLHTKLFNINNWGTETVYKDTLTQIDKQNLYVLKTLNDIDYYEDLEKHTTFKQKLGI